MWKGAVTGFNDLPLLQITDEGDGTGQKIVKPESAEFQIPEDADNGKYDLLFYRRCLVSILGKMKVKLLWRRGKSESGDKGEKGISFKLLIKALWQIILYRVLNFTRFQRLMTKTDKINHHNLSLKLDIKMHNEILNGECFNLSDRERFCIEETIDLCLKSRFEKFSELGLAGIELWLWQRDIALQCIEEIIGWALKQIWKIQWPWQVLNLRWITMNQMVMMI